jgi:hypothetical protein
MRRPVAVLFGCSLRVADTAAGQGLRKKLELGLCSLRNGDCGSAVPPGDTYFRATRYGRTFSTYRRESG